MNGPIEISIGRQDGPFFNRWLVFLTPIIVSGVVCYNYFIYEKSPFFTYEYEPMEESVYLVYLLFSGKYCSYNLEILSSITMIVH